MNNTAPAKQRSAAVIASVLAMALQSAVAASEIEATTTQAKPMAHTTHESGVSQTLTARQQAIVPIAAFAATGDLPELNNALNQGLDAGLTISDNKEILSQLYAYAGFPRSLNALNELMRVLQARKQRGMTDEIGQEPSKAIPTGKALLEAGTANQTKLSGAPVKSALFDFAPAVDEYLKTHLFGDIFERDNLDWRDRELATVAMLSAMPGVEPQLQAHIRISMNVGLTAGQLQQLAQVLTDRVGTHSGQRAQEALKQHLSRGG
ncbi:carboxymuconolactone decarboxylase family protein [Bordetella muralis]|uniref:carboxymuconolactone decarboxylase family protein n=1 Tax=Bordetella muralis TaxID=1649130 RepID=UPI0039F14CC2